MTGPKIPTEAKGGLEPGQTESVACSKMPSEAKDGHPSLNTFTLHHTKSLCRHVILIY